MKNEQLFEFESQIQGTNRFVGNSLNMEKTDEEGDSVIEIKLMIKNATEKLDSNFSTKLENSNEHANSTTTMQKPRGVVTQSQSVTPPEMQQKNLPMKISYKQGKKFARFGMDLSKSQQPEGRILRVMICNHVVDIPIIQHETIGLMSPRRKKAERDRARSKRVRDHLNFKLRKYQKILQRNKMIKERREYIERIKKKLDTNQMAKDEAEEILKERKEAKELPNERKEAKLKCQEKKVDFYERAKRLEEIPLLEAALAERELQDQNYWEQLERERIPAAIEERELAVATRDRLLRMKPDKDAFLEKLKKERNIVYEDKLKKFEEMLAVEEKKRLQKRKVGRKEDRRINWHKEKERYEQRKRKELKRKEREERQRLEGIARKEQKRIEREEREKRDKDRQEIARKERKRIKREEREKRDNDRQGMLDRAKDEHIKKSIKAENEQQAVQKVKGEGSK